MAHQNLKQFQNAWAVAWKINRDENARDLLIDSCMGLVRKQAQNMKWSGAAFKELESEGVAAILDAIDTFDPTRGHFAAHAYYKIKDALLVSAQTTRNPFKMPISRPEKQIQYKLMPLIAQYETAGMPSGLAFDTACDDLRIPRERAAVALSIRNAISLDVMATEDGEFQEQISAGGPSSEDTIEGDRVSNLLAAAYVGLDDRERSLIELRITADVPMSLDALGAMHGISRERVCQILRKAMKHLRFELEKQGLELSDLLSAPD